MSHTFKTKWGLSASFVLLITLGLEAQPCPSITSITATPANVCSGGNSQLQVTANTTSEYAITSALCSLISTPETGITTLSDGGTESTALTNGNLDDGDWEDQALPFSFDYFGASYTSFAVSTNGFITLGSGAPTTYNGYGNAFPGTDAAANAIAVVYANLDFSSAGLINYFTTGTAPNRILVINFDGQFYDGSGSFVVSQLLLHETSNAIEIRVVSSPGDAAAVEGIQDATGSTAYTIPGRNKTSWAVTSAVGYKFTEPSGVVTPSGSHDIRATVAPHG